MTTASFVNDEGLRVVPDGVGFKSFKGEQIARYSNEQPDRQQWLELELFRYTDGTGRYCLLVIGNSVAFHQAGKFCTSGVETKYSDLPEDAEPCKKCRPPTESDGRTVFLEIPKPNAYRCDNAAEVIGRLKIPEFGRRGPNINAGKLTSPGRHLLIEAATKDAAIKAEFDKTEPL